ncbi:MAG: hypothetical protein ACO2OZ_12000 [Acidilobaceae archaeon]
MVSARVLGLTFIILGILGGVGYAYLVLYTSQEVALLVLRVTAAVAALAVGSLIAGVGIALVLGWREFEEAKSRLKGQEGSR